MYLCRWDVAVWMYLGALHHLDFSPKAAAEMQVCVGGGTFVLGCVGRHGHFACNTRIPGTLLLIDF